MINCSTKNQTALRIKFFIAFGINIKINSINRLLNLEVVWIQEYLRHPWPRSWSCFCCQHKQQLQIIEKKENLLHRMGHISSFSSIICDSGRMEMCQVIWVNTTNARDRSDKNNICKQVIFSHDILTCLLARKTNYWVSYRIVYSGWKNTTGCCW